VRGFKPSIETNKDDGASAPPRRTYTQAFNWTQLGTALLFAGLLLLVFWGGSITLRSTIISPYVPTDPLSQEAKRMAEGWKDSHTIKLERAAAYFGSGAYQEAYAIYNELYLACPSYPHTTLAGLIKSGEKLCQLSHFDCSELVPFRAMQQSMPEAFKYCQ